MLVARVLTDVAGIDKEFDYLVPPPMEGVLAVGDQVRLQLGPRRVGGWVVAIADAAGEAAGPTPGGEAAGPTAVGEMGRDADEARFFDVDRHLNTEARALRPIAKRRGIGPEPEMLDLAAWAAWRWAGRRAAFMVAASAGHAVGWLSPPALRAPVPPPRLPFEGPLPTEVGVHILRLPPAGDPTPIVAAVAQGGPTLVVVSTTARAEVLAARLRRAGGDVALLPGDWERARAGAAVVIGARAAAWGPCPGLAGAVVLDGHEEGLTQEGVPTWSALTVVAERARRAGVPCLVTSACPTPELLALGPVHRVGRVEEKRGWATFEVIDRRGDDPRLGLYSPRLVNLVRESGSGSRGARRVACILNRTGRVRLLACGNCGELVRCEECAMAMSSPEPGGLECAQGHRRPAVCAHCDSIRLRSLRIGVSRARDDLEVLAGRPVGEVTGASSELPDTDVLVGTEALLRRLDPSSGVDAVAFVDFDQELLAPRMRAADEALALLTHASRLVRGAGGRVIVQTRLPEHAVVRAALAGDPAVSSDAQIPTRRALGLPPFAVVALVHGDAAEGYVAALGAGSGPEIRISGPAGGRWMVRAPDYQRLCDALAAVARPAAGSLRVAVEPGRL